MLKFLRTLFGRVQTIANVDSDEIRLGTSRCWTEVHHSDAGGSFQRMRLDDDNIVVLSVGLATVKVFVTPLQPTNQGDFRELREFAIKNGMERHTKFTSAQRNTNDLLLLEHLRRAIGWPTTVHELSDTLNRMDGTL